MATPGKRKRDSGKLSVLIAILVYGIGYMGLRQPEVFRYETAEYPVHPKATMTEASPASDLPSAPRCGIGGDR